MCNLGFSSHGSAAATRLPAAGSLGCGSPTFAAIVGIALSRKGRAGEQTRTMTRFPSVGFCSFLQQTMPGAVVHSRALHIRRGSLAVRERITFSSVTLKGDRQGQQSMRLND